MAPGNSVGGNDTPGNVARSRYGSQSKFNTLFYLFACSESIVVQ